MTSGRRISLAFATDVANLAPSLVFNLWLLRRVAAEADAAEFGLYGQISQVAAYLTILQLGLDFAAAQRVAAALGAGDTVAAARVFRQLRWFNRLLAIGVAVLVAGWVGVAAWVGPPAGVASGTQIGLVALTGSTQVATVLARTPSAALIGSELTYLANICRLGRMTLAVGIGLTLIGRWGVLVLPLAELVSQFVACVTLEWMKQWRCPWVATPIGVDQWAGWGGLVRYGVGVTVGGLAWTIEAGLDVFLLDWLPGGGGLPAVAAYTLWWRFPQMAFTVCGGLNYSAFPSFARVAADPLQARQALARVALPACGLATAAVVGIGGWLAPFVHHWLGGRYDRADGPTLAILMGLLVGLRLYGNLVALFWLATGRSRLTTILCWVQAATKLGLSLVLVPYAGMPGLIVASCVSVCVQSVGVGWFLWRSGLLGGRIAVGLVAMLAMSVAVAAGLARTTVSSDLTTTVVGIGLTGMVLAVGLLPLIRAARRPAPPDAS